jgi:hypothetical protein
LFFGLFYFKDIHYQDFFSWQNFHLLQRPALPRYYKTISSGKFLVRICNDKIHFLLDSNFYSAIIIKKVIQKDNYA